MAIRRYSLFTGRVVDRQPETWGKSPHYHILRTVRRFPLPASVPLSTRGGLIRLPDGDGEEVDGVSYTRQEARRKHGSLTF